MAVCQGLGSKVLMTLPLSSRTSFITCGVMTIPLLPTPAATRAICSGEAAVLNWPIDACPSNAFDFFVSGNLDTAALGRSIGGRELKPNFPAPAVILS
jgi:hypothetical protein